MASHKEQSQRSEPAHKDNHSNQLRGWWRQWRCPSV